MLALKPTVIFFFHFTEVYSSDPGVDTVLGNWELGEKNLGNWENGFKKLGIWEWNFSGNWEFNIFRSGKWENG